MDGAGNSQALLHYRMIDGNGHTGISYYRLKQTDHDGTSTMSDVRVVMIDDNTSGHVLYPNPAKDRIMLSGLEDIRAPLLIFSGTGALVREVPVTQDAGTLTIPVGDLSEGVYVLQVGAERIRFVKTSR